MDSPNTSRLRITAVVAATALFGLVGGTAAVAVGSTHSPVVEGTSRHVSVVVPADAWQAKCAFFVAQTAKSEAAKAAAEAKAEKLAAEKAAKAEKLAADKAAAKEARAEKIAAWKAEKAEKLAALKAAKQAKADKAAAKQARAEKSGKWGNDGNTRWGKGGWKSDRWNEGSRDGRGCEGHDGDKDWSDKG